MRYQAAAIAWLALWLGATAGVRAEPMPALAIELHGELPFARAQLEDALLPRLHNAAIEIRAAALGATAHVSAHDHGVHVQIGPRRRIVPLGERTGAAAARVVALVLLDLVPAEGPTLPMPLMPTPTPAPDPAADAATSSASDVPPKTSLDAPPSTPPDAPSMTYPDDPSLTLPAPVPTTPQAHAQPPAAQPPAAAPRALAYERQPPPIPAPAPSIPAPAPPGAATQAGAAMQGPAGPLPWQVRLSAFGGAIRGPRSGDAGLFSAGADARVGLGAWRAGVGTAWVRLPATDYGQTALGLHGLAVRVEAGRALGDIELTAAAFATPYRLRAGLGSDPGRRPHHDGVLLGGGVAARAGAQLAPAWRLEASAGLDVYGRRLRARDDERVLMSTPAVTLSINVGLSWQVSP